MAGPRQDAPAGKEFCLLEAWRDEILEKEETERHKLERRIAAEEDWVRYGVSGRRKRNVGRLDRLRSLRTERRGQIPALGSGEKGAAGGSRFRPQGIDAQGGAFSFGGGG